MLVALLLPGAHAGLPVMPPSSFDFEPPPLDARELCFPGGLRLQLVQQPAGGAVAISTVVPAGSADETDETRGIAHLLEHLWLTRARPGGGPTVWDRAAGLELQGQTLRDATVYTTVGAAADLDRLLALEAARIVDPLAGVSPAALESEKRIVSSEAYFRGEHGARSALRALRRRLYPEGHPYRSGLPAPDELDGLDLETLQAWAASHYAVDGMTIRIEGDLPSLDPDRWAQHLEDAFGEELLYLGSSRCPAPTLEQPPGPPEDNTIERIEAPVLFPRVFAGWTLPPVRGDDAVRMRMATDVLELRTGWSCVLMPGLLSTELICEASYRDEHSLDEGFRYIVKRIDQLWLEELPEVYSWWGIPSPEARTFSETLLWSDDLSSHALVERALLGHVTGELDPIAPMLESVFGEGGRIGAFGERWLTPERVAAVALIPHEEVTDAGEPLQQGVRLEAPARPEPWHTAGLDPTRVSGRILDNGLQAWVVRDSGSLAATSSLVFPVGRVHGAPTSAELFERLRRYRMPERYSTVLNRVGLSSGERIGSLATLSVAHGATALIPNMLWIQRAKLEGLRLDLSERHNSLDAGLDWAEELSEISPWMISDDVRLQRLLPDHPAGLPWWEELLAARRVPSGKLWAWAQTTYHPQGAQLLLVGDVEPIPALGNASRYLVGFKGKRRRPLEQSVLPPPGPRQVLLLEAPRAQAEVTLSCRLPGRTAGTDAALDVLAEVLRRGLWQSLREDGGNYVFSTDVEPTTAELSILTMSTLVAPAQAGGAASVLLELLALVRDGAPEEVVAWGRQAAAGAWGRRWSSTRSTTAALRSELSAGLTMEQLQGWPERLDAVDPGALSALLGDCVDHEVATVIGPDLSGVRGGSTLDWQAQGAEIFERLR